MRYLVIAFALLISHSSALYAKEWRLALCYGENATEDDKKYRSAIGQSAAAVFSSVDSNANTEIKVRNCVKEPDIACYADESAIYCREEAFSQIVRTAAWLAADRALIYVAKNGDSSSLNAKPLLTWSDAYLLAEADRYPDAVKLDKVAQSIVNKRGLTGQDLDSLYKLALDVHKHINNNEEIDKNNKSLVIAVSLYKTSVKYAFAFLLGLEGFHYNGNKCDISADSILKVKNVWPVIVKLQQKNGLFDKKNRIELSELNADHCGFKWLEKISLNSQNENEKVLNAMGKQMAIDLLASPILIGLNGDVVKNSEGDDAPQVKILQGYLYPQSRLVLASATLRLTERYYPEVTKLCNSSAKAIVTIIQTAVSNYPDTSGEMPDELLAELPPGVEKAWNGIPWNENSYTCATGSM